MSYLKQHGIVASFLAADYHYLRIQYDSMMQILNYEICYWKARKHLPKTGNSNGTV